jgi:hypothetical protein
MHPNVLKRLNDSKMYGNEYSTSQFLTDLTDAAFAADMQTTVNTYRRNLQIEYTKRLLYAAGLMTPALTNSYYDNLTQVAAYTQVRRLQKQLEAALTSGDKETQDHRQYLLDYIRRSLEKRN